MVKYYRRPKRSSNKIRVLETKLEFRKKKNLTSLIPRKMRDLLLLISAVHRSISLQCKPRVASSEQDQAAGETVS